MEYSKLISVTGLGGLFELVASKADGAIVKSLDDKSTKFVSSRQHSFSHLESIEIYTVRDNVNLADIFNAMGENAEPLPSEKDPAAIKAYFTKVYPDLDFDRVYTSDMKKMVRWFGILKANGVEIKLREEAALPEEDDDATETVNPEAAQAKAETTEAGQKPAKKAARKKEPEAESEESTETAEEKPKKKAAPKKKKTEE